MRAAQIHPVLFYQLKPFFFLAVLFHGAVRVPADAVFRRIHDPMPAERLIAFEFLR